MGKALKNFLLLLGSQIPVIGIAVAWWSGVLRNPILAAGAAVVCELIVLTWVTIGKDVWEQLKPEIVKSTADWVKTIILNPGFRRRYNRQLIYKHRVFNVRGLRTQGVYLEVEQVFVELNIAPSHPLQASSSPISFKTLSGSQPVWEFWRRLKKQEATALVIVGPPGCGKTTLLQHVALTFATNRQRRYHLRAYTPLLLFLREHINTIVEQSPSLAELAQGHFSDQKRYPEISPPPEWFPRQLKAGKCLVLLDGLNEVVDVEQRQKIAIWVDKQIRHYPHCYFILTARPQGYRDAPLTRAYVLEVMPFNAEQVKRFIHKWYLANKIISYGKDNPGVRQNAEHEAQDLLRRIQEQPRLKELTVNPLLLTMIANVHTYRGVLPERRVELYAEIFDVLLGHWQQAKGIVDRLTAAQKQTILRPLAEEMMTRKAREMETQKAIEVITPYLKQVGVTETDIPGFLNDLQANSSGLLLEKDAGIWSFAHLTFQEYLCASHWRRTGKPRNWDSTQWQTFITDGWWHETLSFYAAQADATPLIKACLQVNTTPALKFAIDIEKEALKLEPNIRNVLYDFIHQLGHPHLCPIKVEFDGRSGFYINKEEVLRLTITNIIETPIQNVTVELDDTAKYSVQLRDENQRQKIFSEIKKEETQFLEYTIMIYNPGSVTLQLKVNGKVYQDDILEIQAVRDNPYLINTPVRNADDFFGRKIELQTSLSNIIRLTGTHTMIIGEQRSGKTSLLYQIQEHLREPYLPIYISFGGIERHEEKLALNWLLDQIIEEMNRRKHLYNLNGTISLKYCSDFTKFFEEFIQNIKAVNQEYRLVLLLDEAHLMNEISVKFQEVLRETFSKLVRDVRVILACYYDFFENLKTSGSPLQNIFEYLFLKPFEGDDLTNLITEPASRFDYYYEEDAKEAIRSASGGHPYYCQFLCAKSFTEAEESKTKIITLNHIEKAEKQVIDSDKNRFDMGYWNNMRQEDRLFLKRLITGESTDYVSKQIVNRLKQKFIIKELNGKYVFTATLFREWIKQLIQEEG